MNFQHVNRPFVVFSCFLGVIQGLFLTVKLQQKRIDVKKGWRRKRDPLVPPMIHCASWSVRLVLSSSESRSIISLLLFPSCCYCCCCPSSSPTVSLGWHIRKIPTGRTALYWSTWHSYTQMFVFCLVTSIIWF